MGQGSRTVCLHLCRHFKFQTVRSSSRIWNSTCHFRCFLPQHSSGETVTHKQRSALVLVILDCSIVFPLLRNVYYYVSRTSNSVPYFSSKRLSNPRWLFLLDGTGGCVAYRLCGIANNQGSPSSSDVGHTWAVNSGKGSLTDFLMAIVRPV